MSLPPKQRAAIVLCDQVGLSREEAARAIGASVPSVKTELHRARKTMTDVFEHRCALVDAKNECNACMTFGRIKRGQRPEIVGRPTNTRAPMSCAQVQPLLGDLIDGDLLVDQRREVEAHITSCADCRREHRALKRTVRFVRANGRTDIEPGTPGAVERDFTRATADPAYARTPAEVLFGAVMQPAREGDNP